MYPFNFTAGSWAAVVIYFGVSIFAMLFSVVDVIVGEKRDREERMREKALQPDAEGQRSGKVGREER